MKKAGALLFIGVLAVLLASCSSASFNLAGEPEIVATIPPRPTQTQMTTADMPVVPDLATGAALFAENCTDCHGVDGRGNGPLVQSGDVNAAVMTDFTQPSQKSPLERFEIVTNGRLSTLMPPWVNSLSAYERWAVTHYTLSLAYSDEQIALGESLYTDEMPTFEDAAELNDDALVATFGEDLSDDEKRALVAFVRTQGDVVAPLEVAEAPAANEAAAVDTEAGDMPANVGMITGQLVNESGGGFDSDMVVTLHMIDHNGNDLTIDTPVNDDGSYTFENVPVDAMTTYVVAAFHEERFFSSQFMPGGPINGTLDLSVALYDVTDDPSVITIEGVIYQVTDNEDGTLTVLQVVNLNNSSNRMFAGHQTLPNSTRYPSVFVPLLDGAELNETPDSAGRYIPDVERGIVFDTRPVMPDDAHAVHLTYTIPYDAPLSIDQTWPYAIEGYVEIYLPDGMLLDSERIGSTNQVIPMGNTTFNVFAADVNQAGGEPIAFTLSGEPIAPVASQTATVGDRFGVNRGLAWVFGIAGGILMVVSVLMFVQTMPKSQKATATDDPLLEKIYQLEQDYKAGKIQQAAYDKRMDKLKQQLRQQMNNSRS